MVSAAPLATRVSVRNMEVVDDVCRSAFGCGGIDVTTIALLLLTGVLALLVLAAIVHVHEATSLVEEERARLAAERDAFDAFSRRLASVEVSEVTTTVAASGGLAVETSTMPDDRLARVKDAYRDTVMSVPHYEEDYGESLAENLAAEFGDGLAFAVVDGRQLTPPLKSALLAASDEASRERTAFLSTLEAEAEALAEAATAIGKIDDEVESIADAPPTERSYEELVAEWTRLGALGDRCRELLRSRQEEIRSTSTATKPDGLELHDYLYDELPVSHPVLADLASLADAIGSLRSQLLRSLTRRV